jgi:uncharacterized protein (TIGR01777 family)
MIIAVTGSSGLVGTAVVNLLESGGHLVRRMVRRVPRSADHEIHWDPAAGTIDAAELAAVDAVVHLAGENIAAHRWTDAFKAQLRDSRVRGTQLLCETIAGLSTRPSVLVSASAVGYYGNRGDELLAESSPPGRGFLAEVCQQWEAQTQLARDAGVRVVNLRIGVVLSANGGALAEMLTPFKLGVGGPIGSGRQYLSWITIDDLARVIEFAIHTTSLTGPVNAVAPEPVTNREFTKNLGRVLRRPTALPMPAFAARLVFGEMADELLMTSTRVQPRALTVAGFTFQWPQLEPALRHMLHGE